MGGHLGSYGPCNHCWLQHGFWNLLGHLCCFAFGTNAVNGMAFATMRLSSASGIVIT